MKYGVKWETVGRGESRGGSVTPKQGAHYLKEALLLSAAEAERATASRWGTQISGSYRRSDSGESSVGLNNNDQLLVEGERSMYAGVCFFF